MPGAVRSFEYTLTPAPEDLAKVEARARKVLAAACDGDDRITCHDVSGTPLGVVTLSLTVHGRDRWWATQLAQDVLNFVLWGLQTNATKLDLQSRRLEPHTNRGYAHGRQKTYRETGSSVPSSSSSASSSTSSSSESSSTSSSSSSTSVKEA